MQKLKTLGRLTFLLILAFCLLLPLGCKARLNEPSATSLSIGTSAEPIVTPMPTPAETPLPLSGLTIGIDPGHQLKPDYSREPIAPGSKETKAKVSTGTRGLKSGVYEYELTLKVGLKLKSILESYGAAVVMTRETNDINISNIERAKLFNQTKTDYAVRLHLNGKKDTSVHGAFVLIPKTNPYQKDCRRAAELLLSAYCEKTGAKNDGITERSDQSGFNFCNRMIINIEMGHLTNAQEEQNLISDAYQQKMAQGIADGILRYFEK